MICVLFVRICNFVRILVYHISLFIKCIWLLALYCTIFWNQYRIWQPLLFPIRTWAETHMFCTETDCSLEFTTEQQLLRKGRLPPGRYRSKTGRIEDCRLAYNYDQPATRVPTTPAKDYWIVTSLVYSIIN